MHKKGGGGLNMSHAQTIAFGPKALRGAYNFSLIFALQAVAGAPAPRNAIAQHVARELSVPMATAQVWLDAAFMWRKTTKGVTFRAAGGWTPPFEQVEAAVSWLTAFFGSKAASDVVRRYPGLLGCRAPKLQSVVDWFVLEVGNPLLDLLMCPQTTCGLSPCLAWKSNALAGHCSWPLALLPTVLRDACPFEC
jgi:hypothetical protein